MEFEDTNLDIENMTLPNQFDDFPLPVFDTRQTPFSPTSPGGKRSPGRPRTMKDYEEDLANLKKENFNLKVRIYFLEQHRVDPSLPKDVDELRHLYTSLKVEHDLQKKDLETKENLLLDTYKALDVQKQQLEAVTEERDKFTCTIEELKQDLKDYQQRFMETSVPHLDDTNALYAVTFGLNANQEPARADPLTEEKIRELQDELSKEKERVLMLEEEMLLLNEKTVDDQKNVQKLGLQLRDMEEKFKNIIAERNKYEELYSNTSTLTSRLEKSLKRKIDVLKEKDAEAEKWKCLAEELRKQLTRVENQLQEVQERNSKSHNEKQVKILAENEKLKHEVRYLQQLAEKWSKIEKGRSSECDQELKEAQKRQAELSQELEVLKGHLVQSKSIIQTMCKEKKHLHAQLDKYKRTVRNISGNSLESSKEEVL